MTNDLANIGDITNGTTVETTIPSAVETVSKTMSLPAGVYVIWYWVSINVAANAQFQAAIKRGNTSIGSVQVYGKNSGNGLFRHCAVSIIELTSASTINGTIYVNNGSDTAIIDHTLRAVRIK